MEITIYGVIYSVVIIFLIILFLFYLWIESGSYRLPVDYQAELDKILPLDEEVRGKIYPTRIETHVAHVIMRGIVINVNRTEERIEDINSYIYSYTYNIESKTANYYR